MGNSSENLDGSMCFSLIIPTYNEAENIAELVFRITSSCRDLPFEVIFVDDASTDGTGSIIKELKAIYGNVKILARPRKLGLASAVLAGAAIARSGVIAVMDADLQHPPEVLPLLYRKIAEGYDVVIASRYADGGGVEEWGFWRRLVSQSASWVTHVLIPETRGIKDPLSGYFMVKKGVLDGASPYLEGFKILVVILAAGKYNSVTEVPYVFRGRKRGRSKLGADELITYVKLLLRLRRRLKHEGSIDEEEASLKPTSAKDFSR